MPATGGNQGTIPGNQALRPLPALKQQAGATSQDQYPLVPLLVVPLPLRGGLAVGDDPLDAYGVRLYKGVNDLAGQGRGEAG